MAKSEARDQERGVVLKLMQVQLELHAHIVILCGQTQEAFDILQETNRQIIELAEEREGMEHFLAWAKKIAYYQVRSWRTRQQRDRLVFDDTMFERLADMMVAQSSQQASERVEALNQCLQLLPEKMHELFMTRHIDRTPVRELAEMLGRMPDSLSVTLHRLRLTLRKCILEKLAVGGASV